MNNEVKEMIKFFEAQGYSNVNLQFDTNDNGELEIKVKAIKQLNESQM